MKLIRNGSSDDKEYEVVVPGPEQKEMVPDTMKDLLMHWLDTKQIHRCLLSNHYSKSSSIITKSHMPLLIF